jgi:pimeloyl-ACP methyl ester carboxylesterase
LLRLVAVAPLAIFAAASCSDDPVAPATEPTSLLEPGEICDSDNRPDLKLTFDPPAVVVAAGQVRPVRLIIEPDACDPTKATFESANVGIAEAPAAASFDLRHATYDFQVKGGSIGRTTITASMTTKDVNGQEFVLRTDLPIDVRDGAAPGCSAGDAPVSDGQLAGGSTELRGKGSLAKAVLSVRGQAFARSDEFALPPFPGSVTCNEGDLTSSDPKLVKLGPAVTFTARAPLSTAKPLRREVDFALPINPATMPPAARLRHLVVLYSGPKAKTPRPVTIANPRIEADGDDYVLKFSSPWFGTYQAAMASDAGTKMRKRKLTHRAVIGISMGGGGAATFGIRHHDKVDVIGALGGPVDYTWLLHFIEEFALGGFCPVGKTCPTTPPNLYPVDSPYAHTMDYDHWFFEKGEGNGGSWGRDNYIQAFEDLAIANANPNGWNADSSLLHLAMGPKATDPWVKGPDGIDCSIPIEPIKDDPNNAKQRERENACKAWRCNPSSIWKAETNYFDDEYNPDGTLPVISFCDGNDTGSGSYSLSYGGPGGKPMNLALAVDLNNNGVRDEGEPIIRSGHEPFDDCGTDGLCNEQEPGYDAELNPDPNQDDYDYTINPTGTEGNHVYDMGEPFRDFGLDGVPDTKDKHVAGDPGEGDGVFTQSPGFDAFLKNDPHQIIAGRSVPPAGPMTDDALRRLDILTDGGVRDLFNFSILSSHLTGAISARKVRGTAFYNGFDMLPGQTPGAPNDFTAHTLRWNDIADFPSIRYGDIDATEAQKERGDGKHVGTGPQVLSRLQNAFFYVAKAWPDADRRVSIDTREKPASSTINELGIECEIIGKCSTVFTGPKTKRTGPVSVTLPPGYAHEDNVKRGVRYPVLFVLHGYGQTPSELEALAIFSNNFMNLANRSYATRLGKFITVYVDGRCREQDGRPECIRGTFYLDSARPGGAVVDSWFEELLDYVDENYRTLGPSEVDVPE